MTEWKKVPNYNYEVSNFGEVRNAKTKKILKQGLGTSDYYRVSFSLGCKGTPKIMFVAQQPRGASRGAVFSISSINLYSQGFRMPRASRQRGGKRLHSRLRG